VVGPLNCNPLHISSTKLADPLQFLDEAVGNLPLH
jgi:hypothetical protein